MRLLVIAIVVLFSACASEPQPRWTKAGASRQDFEQDYGQCQAQAFSVTGAPLMQVAVVLNGCMRGRGWQ